MRLTAYSDDYDPENEMGYRGDCFLEPTRPGEVGAWIGKNSLSNNLVLALEKIRQENTTLDEICLMYRTPEGQMFRRFTVN